MIEDLKAMLDAVTRFGVYGVLLILLILFVHDPSRAEKVKLAALTPFFHFWKWGARQYLATRVGLSLSEFYRHQISGKLSSSTKFKFKVRWVATAADPVLKKNGTLILRLQETNDQTRNILSAAKVALTKAVCPTLRWQIKPSLHNAIDLTLLRKLTERLGKHAYPVFLKHFLEPQTKGDSECSDLLSELVEVDQAGLFVAMFLEELTLLGDYAFSRNDRLDKTDSIKKFLVLLLGMARRETFEEIELEHLSEDFQVGVLYLAITRRAATEGVTPYVKRINRRIREGCSSIYIIAFKPAESFLETVIKAVGDDVRITAGKVVVQPRDRNHCDRISIVQLKIGPGFADAGFEEQLKERNLSEGDTVTGKIIDVAEHVALVSVEGITGSITKTESDWSTVTNCCGVFSVGEVATFQVQRFDRARGMLVLSRRFEDQDPFKIFSIPSIGETAEIVVVDADTTALIGRREDGLEIQIPFSEVSWVSERPEDPSEFLEQELSVAIYEVDESRRLVRGSLRKLIQDPWPDIHKRFPAGTQLRGTVVEIDRLLHFVRVEIADHIVGIVPAESMIAAGYEYRDFENTLVLGQKLDVVVTKVFVAKRRIRLELQRNVATAPA